MVTERVLQITLFCVLLIWQNLVNMLNTNHLSFIYSFLLSFAFLLLMHTARHSYATVLKRSGVSTAIISESLGHSSEKVTQIYLDSFENSQIDEAMKNLL